MFQNYYDLCINLYFSAPTNSPSNLEILQLTAVSASMTWKPVSKSSLKGKFTKYTVNLKESDGTVLMSYDETNEDSIEFHDLRPFTEYLVNVAACNSAGCGPRSPDFIFTTLQAGIMN